MVSHDAAVKRQLASVNVPADRSAVLRYGVAIASPLAASLAIWAFGYQLNAPLLLELITAVIVTVWFGSWKPGLVSAALSLAIGIYVFYPQLGFATPAGRQNLFRLAAFVLAAGMICRMNLVLRRAQDELRHSQAHLAGVVQISEDAIISIDQAQRIRLFNRGAEQIFGYPADAVLGEPLSVLLPPRFAEAHRHYVNMFSA